MTLAFFSLFFSGRGAIISNPSSPSPAEAQFPVSVAKSMFLLPPTNRAEAPLWGRAG